MTNKQLYLKFRQELDKMCVPVILSEQLVFNIDCYLQKVGIICTDKLGRYIDCVYILPKYRRKGIAKNAVLAWYENFAEKDFCPRLHIINTNETALKFWNNLFELEIIETNPVDTLYQINGLKGG